VIRALLGEHVVRPCLLLGAQLCSGAVLLVWSRCRDFDLASKKKNDFLVSMDMHEDAVIIIDAVGTILMISQVRCVAREAPCGASAQATFC